jgi:hypothetical protein
MAAAVCFKAAKPNKPPAEISNVRRKPRRDGVEIGLETLMGRLDGNEPDGFVH